MTAIDLARRIELAMPAAFANFATNKASGRTQTALTTFGELGHALGFAVQCKRSCYPKADQGEWLYDQIWFVNHATKQGFLTRLPMVLESEFDKPDRGIDDDFPKLVQARADVRIWLWWSVAARKHINLCKDQIIEFGYTLPGDEWVFGVFDWLARKPIIERFTVTRDLLPAGREVANA
jgi:hypothetical protein